MMIYLCKEVSTLVMNPYYYFYNMDDNHVYVISDSYIKRVYVYGIFSNSVFIKKLSYSNKSKSRKLQYKIPKNIKQNIYTYDYIPSVDVQIIEDLLFDIVLNAI